MTNQLNKKREAIKEKIDALTDREKQLKAQLRSLDAKEKSSARKKETRAKIILGGFIVAHAKKGEQSFINLFDQAISESSDRDKDTLTEYRDYLINPK